MSRKVKSIQRFDSRGSKIDEFNIFHVASRKPRREIEIASIGNKKKYFSSHLVSFRKLKQHNKKKISVKKRAKTSWNVFVGGVLETSFATFKSLRDTQIDSTTRKRKTTNKATKHEVENNHNEAFYFSHFSTLLVRVVALESFSPFSNRNVRFHKYMKRKKKKRTQQNSHWDTTTTTEIRRKTRHNSQQQQ